MMRNQPSHKQHVVLAVAILASFIAFLDGSVVNVALPSITRDLGGGLPAQQWVVDAYLLALGSVILLAGSLSDAFGRKRVLLWGIIGFAAASVGCALAPDPGLLILARGVQGLAGALLVPSSLALILSAFSGGQQARAIGTWTAFTSVASIAGPLLGGVLVDTLSWRWVFAVNLVPIAATLLLLHWLDDDAQLASQAHIDVAGAALGVVGLGLPVFALIEGPHLGWRSVPIIAALALGATAIAAFLLWERHSKQPMLPLTIFRARNFSVGNAATALVYGGLTVGTFAFALFLQQSAGYSATLAGFAMAPSSLLLIALSAPIGKLTRTLGPRTLMTIGPVVAGAGFALMLRISDQPGYWSDVLPAVLVFGLGMAVTVAPLTATILGAVDARRSGIASAVNNAVSRVAGLVAVALAGTLGGTGAVDSFWFHRLALVAAVLVTAGGLLSGIGIRGPQTVAGRRPVAHPLALHQ